MTWRGKMIGGSLGSFIGGPWGALAGAAAGHVFVDRKEAATSEKEALRLLAVTAGTLAELAGADGRYTPREDRALRSVLAEISQRAGARLSAQDLAYLVDDASRIDRSPARLAALVRPRPDLARAALVWLWRVAVSDGDPAPAESHFIHEFARHAGLREEDVFHASVLYVRQPRHSSPANGQDRRAACSALGLPYDADAAAVKAAYRALSLKYHPDKHANLDPDIRALAAEKFAQLKTAYDTLSVDGPAPLDPRERLACGAETGRLEPAAPDRVVRCYLCAQKVRLPQPEHLPSARCPACQALLAFERELAEQLV